MSKERVVRFITIFSLSVTLLTLLYAARFHDLNSYAIFESSAPFNGTFNNTIYSSSENAIQLTSGNLFGTYTSKIFNSSVNTTTWNSISIQKTTPEKEYLFAADN